MHKGHQVFSFFVIPAKAGIHNVKILIIWFIWIPASAGMTDWRNDSFCAEICRKITGKMIILDSSPRKGAKTQSSRIFILSCRRHLCCCRFYKEFFRSAYQATAEILTGWPKWNIFFLSALASSQEIIGYRTSKLNGNIKKYIRIFWIINYY